jgi:hypothetical protein
MTKEDIQRALDLARAALHHQNHGMATNKELLLAKALLHVHKTSAEALKFYAEGHDHNSELYHKLDCDKIPVFVKTVNLIEEFSKGKSAEQVIKESTAPEFKFKSGKRARLALDDIGATE